MQILGDVEKEEALKQEYYAFTSQEFDWNSPMTYVGLTAPMIIFASCIYGSIKLFNDRLEKKELEQQQISESINKRDNSLKINDL